NTRYIIAIRTAQPKASYRAIRLRMRDQGRCSWDPLRPSTALDGSSTLDLAYGAYFLEAHEVVPSEPRLHQDFLSVLGMLGHALEVAKRELAELDWRGDRPECSTVLHLDFRKVAVRGDLRIHCNLFWAQSWGPCSTHRR